MGSRRKAREHVLLALYAADMEEQPHDEALSALWDSLVDDTDGDFGNRPADAEEVEFSRVLVEGVAAQKAELDTQIDACSNNWRVERMSLVDRNILRMGVFELTALTDIPVNVSLNEMVELGKKYGTIDSGGFINGILDRIARNIGRL